MIRQPSGKHGARDLGLAAAYTLVLTLMLALPTGNQDLPVFTSIDVEIAVALVFGYTSLGGFGLGLVVGRWWVLWSPAVMVLLSIPIVAVNVVVHDPEPDGQGGMHIVVLAFVAVGALAVGVAVAGEVRRRRLQRFAAKPD